MTLQSRGVVCMIWAACTLAGAAVAWAGPPCEEIAGYVRQHALRQPDPGLFDALMAPAVDDAAVNAALRRFDRYAAWYSPEALAARRSAGAAATGGVGMDLVQDRLDHLVCIPYAGGPAQQAGLRYGDELVAVDGKPVQGMAVEEVIQAIRGTEGTPVMLRTRRPGGERSTREWLLVRQKVEAPLLERTDQDGTPCLRLYQFTPRVSVLLERELTRMAAKPPARLILDLRGNNGGDLESAVACAELFLPRNAISLHSRSVSKEQERRAVQDGPAASWNSELIVWQDGLTASAAEVFISALACLDRTDVQGLTSAGKASVQTLFRLKGGGILKLTTEQLLFPGQIFSWQDSGLRPDTFVGAGSQNPFFVEKKREASR